MTEQRGKIAKRYAVQWVIKQLQTALEDGSAFDIPDLVDAEWEFRVYDAVASEIEKIVRRMAEHEGEQVLVDDLVVAFKEADTIRGDST